MGNSANLSAGRNMRLNGSPASSAGRSSRTPAIRSNAAPTAPNSPNSMPSSIQKKPWQQRPRPFLPVAAQASVIPDRKNEYYKSDSELQAAIAEAMRTEYKMIVDGGFLLQLD